MNTVTSMSVARINTVLMRGRNVAQREQDISVSNQTHKVRFCLCIGRMCLLVIESYSGLRGQVVQTPLAPGPRL